MKKKIMIDTHCHFFSKTMFTSDIAKLVAGLRKNPFPFFRNSIDNRNERLVEKFLDIAYDKSPEQIYELMKKEYDCDFIAVPLMIDMMYTMEKPDDYKNSNDRNGYIRKIGKEFKKMTLDSQNRFLFWLGETVLPKGNLNLISNRSVNFFKNSFEVQLRELIALKKKMPDRVYPFFSIDPRREKTLKHGVLGEIKKYVGEGKPFIGLKIYTGLGYSPTHPVLFDGKKSVYAWCEKNRIPITAHYGETGFAHVLTDAKIEGDIYYPPSGDIIPMEEYSSDRVIRYEKNYMGNTDDMIMERQLMHNHPKLWEKVLERYPKLKINFAHMGGSEQLMAYSLGSKKAFWTAMILGLMEKYPNVYSDLSCFHYPSKNDFTLRDMYNKIYLKMSNKARRKVLYGSDFYMVLLFRPSLKGYIAEFRREFGEDFEKIAYNNPKKFLGL